MESVFFKAFKKNWSVLIFIVVLSLLFIPLSSRSSSSKKKAVTPSSTTLDTLVAVCNKRGWQHGGGCDPLNTLVAVCNKRGGCCHKILKGFKASKAFKEGHFIILHGDKAPALCPEGMSRMAYRCFGSLAWCEPK